MRQNGRTAEGVGMRNRRQLLCAAALAVMLVSCSCGGGSTSACVDAKTLLNDDEVKQFLGGLDAPATATPCDSSGHSTAQWKAAIPPAAPGGIPGSKAVKIDLMRQDEGSFQEGVAAFKAANPQYQYSDVTDVGGAAFGWIAGMQEAVYLWVKGLRIYLICTQVDTTTPPGPLPPFDGLKLLAQKIVGRVR